MPTPADDATARIADYVLSVRTEDLPSAVRKEGLRSFINILGCTVGGSRHEAVAIMDKALRPFAGAGTTTLIGLGRKSDALTACLLNTYSSSVNTNDDTHAEAIVHPGGPIMGAVLAVAENQKVSGADLLTAFTLGIEFACRLSKAISVTPAKGSVAWSQTGVVCGIGAAIAAGKLIGLDAQGMRRAIGIATSDATGVRGVQGSMCTAYLPARAGQTGLRAAYLAQAGFTCNEQVIEHRYGFVNCFAQTPHYPHLVDGLGTHFEASANTYKPYPCGIVINPLIDGALKMRAKHNIDAAQVERVDMNVSSGAIALCDRRHPKDEFEGQVSLYQWVAAAFVRGRAGIGEGTDAAIADPALLAFRDRIHPVATPSIAIDAVDITVTMKDGTKHSMQLRDCIGSKGQPMTDRDIEQKFEQLAEGSLTNDRVKRLIADCWQIDKMPDAAVIAASAA